MAERSTYVQGLGGQPLTMPSGQRIKRMSHGSGAPYQGGGNSRRVRGWNAPGSGPTDAAVGNATNLRNRSRSQYRNDPYAKAGINKLVSNIVGTGIKPRSTAEDKAFQKTVHRWWKGWAPQSDPEGLLSVYGQQMQAVNTWLQGGEAFVRARPRRESDGLTVPLQLQIMEPEMCPIHWNGYWGRNVIRHGIEFDLLGRRTAYWFYKAHPGDSSWLRVDSQQLTRVPASEVIHLFDPVRPGQIRGVPHMAQVLLRMYDLDKYDDATLLRQQIANLFAMFIQKQPDEDDGSPTSPITGEAAEDKGDDLPSIGLEPGIVQELAEGEVPKFSDPPDAGSTYSEFLFQQLLAVSAGFEEPYEVMTGDFSKISDRTARLVLQEFRRRMQQMQHHIVIHQMCRRIWEWWLPRAVLAGLEAPGYADAPEQYQGVKWIPQAWPYMHPLQDVQADNSARRSGFKTRAEIVSERTGEDIDDVHEQLAEENAAADELGLQLDSDSRYTSGSGVTQARPVGSEFPDVEGGERESA